MGNRKSGNGSTAIHWMRVSRQQQPNQCMGKDVFTKRMIEKRGALKKIISSFHPYGSALVSVRPFELTLTHTQPFMSLFLCATPRAHKFTYAISIYANVLSQTHISLGKVRFWKTTSIFSEINADKNVDWTSTLVWYISRIYIVAHLHTCWLCPRTNIDSVTGYTMCAYCARIRSAQQ